MSDGLDNIFYDMTGVIYKNRLFYTMWKLSLIEEEDGDDHFRTHMLSKHMEIYMKDLASGLMTDLERSMFDSYE